MPTYLAPGVYVEELDGGSKPLEAAGTALERAAPDTLVVYSTLACPFSSVVEVGSANEPPARAALHVITVPAVATSLP